MSPLTYRTPKNSGTIVCLILGLYLLRPLVDYFYYTTGLRMGAFPTNADSIGIPLSAGWAAWFIGWPIILLLTIAVALIYTGNLPFTFFDRTRPVWSLLWTAPVLILTVWTLLGATYNLRYLQIVDFVDAVMVSYVLLSLRSSLIAYRHSPPSPEPAIP
jgi:hypothetical protein